MANQVRSYVFNCFSRVMANHYSLSRAMTTTVTKQPSSRFLSSLINFQRVNGDQIANRRRKFSCMKDDGEVMLHSTSFLLPSSVAKNYALIVLNQPLPRFTPLLWDHAKVRVCADGGANRLYDGIPRFFPQLNPFNVRKSYKPDVIKGDLDSIRADVLDYYANLGCDAMNESDDQDTTDLHKCLLHLTNVIPESEKSDLCILVTGALGGRFDHEAANLNILHQFSSLRIILLSDDCLIQLLPRAYQHEIHIQPSVVGPHCGLLPMGGPSSRTTTLGLKWNLNDTEMKIGGLISTSNLVSRETVYVCSDADLLWTISINKGANFLAYN